MSLKAWYPLNGDTKDYSGNQNDATNYGSTIDSSGKIGKCYSFDGSSSLNCGSLDSLTQTFRGRSFSACCWVKFTDSDVADKYMFQIGTYGVDTFIHFVRRYGALYMGFYADDLPSYTALSQNVWYHVVFSWNVITQLQSIFINGNLDASRVSSGILNATQGYPLLIGSTLVGSLNDVRIYDHALSTKEIKELAKAKILHYTFNDFQEPTTNMYGDMYTSIGLRPYRTEYNTDAWTASFIKPPANIGRVYMHTSGALTDTWSNNSYGYMLKQYTFDANTSYIMRCWVFVSTDCNIDAIPSIFENFTTTESSIQSYDMSKKGTWQLIGLTCNTASANFGNAIMLYPQRYGVTDGSFTGFFAWGGAQIEHKDHVTPFVIGSRIGIVRDNSGYNNDAVLVESTTPKWTQGKLGSGGYYFRGNGDYIKLGGLGTTFSLGGSTSTTISFWRKNDVTITYWLPFVGQDGSFYIMATSSGTGNFYHSNIGSVWTIYKDGVNLGQTVVPFTDQLWHHYVISGVDLSTWTLIKLSGYTNVWDCEGYFDDVRIYAISLSDADVLELYQTRSALDVNGNLSLNEININGISSDKRNLVEYANWVQGTYTVGQNNIWYGGVYNKAMNFNPNQSGGVTHKIEISNNPIGELDVMSTFIATTTHVNLYSCSQTYYDFAVDSTKTYRFSQWIYLHWGGGTSGGQPSYLGVLGNTVCDLNTTTLNGNPYFVAPVMDDIRHLDKWVLQVYYIYPAGSTGKPAAGALYYPDGTSTVDGGCFTWAAATTSSHIRQYPLYEYGEISVGTYVKYYRPRMEIMDGNEPTISKLLICGTHRIIVDSTGTNTWNLKNISDNGSGNFGGVSEVGITDGLVGYWKLNGDARDYSGNNNHGTVIEAIVSSGLKNQAYSFDGVNDRIMITQPTIPIVTKEITTSAWIYPTVPANPGVKIRGGAISGHANMYLGLVDTGTAWNLHWALETTVSRPGSWSGTIPINQWTYITGTYDGAYMRAYINGVEVWSTALTGNIAYQSDYVIGTYIGALADGNHNFKGKITDVRIYNRSLSVDEINILYKQGLPLTGMQLSSDGTLYINNEIKEGF